mmetsp:Transcript_8965/g.20203  ORF Transcript_8965/g.20203 Transcript_8965/m.20203 type:complete len:206 (+) Transcript_8965:44-661(+)|eukprot:CAMPEP_0172585976 /NCGR_PEP_ID=MMETSP1068-20121228/5375_1 /TAXON_ID=35684 /ORGANISM="Pseudopedinella elastica, Strain CCMP716" /LENGTH=205 /DNA_ID=CAMNT_0013380635 /DNA_START=36 /DNA_END=653 /DNA_ORIENTATION=-
MSSDSSDSESDIPLGELVKSSVAEKKKSPAGEKAKPAAKRPVAKPSEKVVKKPKTAKPAEAPKARAGGAPKNDVDVFFETIKGELVQKLLCRWWYAIEWPSKADLAKAAPVGFEQLDGYPGVYICVRGECMGQLLDNRDAATCPNFDNFRRKGAEELKKLLETALTEQKKALIEAEGPGSAYEDSLKKELAWLSKINTVKADKGK